ncbi:MAG TPA: YciI family protein [Opitutaceae bacterium]|nr:YciI family protein [Opitutaceae bacterium]
MRSLAPLATMALAALAAADCRAEQALADGGTDLYFLVFLRPDPGRKHIEPAEGERIQAAHMANIKKMADEGILVAAGPMEDRPTTISGIFVFKAPSLAEARSIAGKDPTVTEKRNTVDVHPWLGPKGIGAAYSQWKKEHPGAEDAMAAHVLCILRRGPAWTGGPRAGDEHAAFVDSLRRSGLLAAAGVIDGDPDLCAICVFKTDLVDEAKRAIEKDPAVGAGRMAAEFHRWWTADRVLPW